MMVAEQSLSRLHNLRHGWSFQLGPKHAIPEPARDAETVLVVGVMVLHVVFFELLVV